MNKMKSMMKRSRFVLVALATTVLSIAPISPAAARGSAWLSLTSTVADCTWTVNVSWTAWKGAVTLEAFVTEGYDGVALVPSFLPIKQGKSGTASVVLAPLPSSATINMFYAWAQLLDK